MPTVGSFVDGDWHRRKGKAQTVVNPARPRSDVVADAYGAEDDLLLEAVDSAARAAPAWRRTPIWERAEILKGAAATLRGAAEPVGRELTREEGKTLAEAVGEVKRAASIFEYFAAEPSRPDGELFQSQRPDERIYTTGAPLGVVAVITPWNFPIAIPAWKIAPALVYGNCVLWKPASQVPLTARRLTESLVAAGLPPGVLSLLVASGAQAERMLATSPVAAISFTGSTPVGRRLIARCGELAKPIQAEMGGCNAAIVERSAPLDLAAEAVTEGAMRSTGQKCTATSRLIVERAVADPLLERIEQRVKDYVVGDGLAPETQMGPAISAAAKESAAEHVTTAQQEGAEVVARGSVPKDPGLVDGHFVAPTVLRLSTHEQGIWRQEVFAPILSVVTVDDLEQALARANESAYGLSASIFSNDLAVVERAVEALDAGVVHVNSETTGADPHVPFGGWKESGFGPREQGRAARQFFTRSKTVYSRPAGS